MIRRATVAIAAACMAISVSATQVYGSSDCGTWVAAKTEPLSRRAQELWLVGYLSGLNAMHDRTGLKPADPLGRVNSMTQVFLWMDNYCQANPLKFVVQGADGLWLELNTSK